MARIISCGCGGCEGGGYGASGDIVEATADFPAAFARARAFARDNNRPALIELRYPVKYITPDTRLGTAAAVTEAAAAEAKAATL